MVPVRALYGVELATGLGDLLLSGVEVVCCGKTDSEPPA